LSGHAYDKGAWRRRNAEFLLASRLCGGGPLRCPYVELLGTTGDLSFREMRRAGLLRGRGCSRLFVGIDRDGREVRLHRGGGARFRTVRGDALQACNELRMSGMAPGAVNLDLEAAAGSRRWWRRSGPPLAALAKAGAREHGSFCLILNCSLDGGCRSSGLPAREVLRGHAGMAAQALGGLGLREEDALPPGAEEALDVPGFTGDAGMFEVYRSRGRRSRMVTLRCELPPAL